MPGWEVVGELEERRVMRVFDENRGIAFAHGFDGLRKFYAVRDLEKKVCEVTGAKYCQAVSSGSAGLYCALRAIGVGPGDEVITSAFTFIATVEAIMLCGAKPVCVGIDRSLNIDPEEVLARITPRTKAIIPVHMAGAPADMSGIIDIAEDNEIKVVEDACQALGARTGNGDMVGTLGDMGVYSLDAGKIIQCGEGGLIVTNNESLYEMARMCHDHGHDYKGPGRALEHPRMVGFNFRMTELQAMYALAQLDRLPSILANQKRNKEMIESAGVKDDRVFYGEDAGDTIIKTYDSAEHAGRVVAKMKAAGLGTKNLPDAMIWHCAAFWDHVFPKAMGMFMGTLLTLQRAVAIPVPVNMAADYPARVAEALA